MMFDGKSTVDRPDIRAHHRDSGAGRPPMAGAHPHSVGCGRDASRRDVRASELALVAVEDGARRGDDRHGVCPHGLLHRLTRK